MAKHVVGVKLMSELHDKRKSKTNVRFGGSSMPTNPYHHALNCLGGKWKMTLIHEMANFGFIRFNRTRKALKMSEKVLSAQLVELIDAGVVRRNVDIKTNPPTVTYALTESGKRLIPIIDAIYIWSMRDMCEHHIPVDMDALFVHSDDKYIEPLENVLDYEAYQKVVNLKDAKDSTGDKGQSLDPRILTY